MLRIQGFIAPIKMLLLMKFKCALKSSVNFTYLYLKKCLTRLSVFEKQYTVIINGKYTYFA